MKHFILIVSFCLGMVISSVQIKREIQQIKNDCETEKYVVILDTEIYCFDKNQEKEIIYDD